MMNIFPSPSAAGQRAFTQLPARRPGGATLPRAEKRAVLILAYYYPPMNESGALRPARFAKYLRYAGIKVRVVSAWKDREGARFGDEDDSTPVVQPLSPGSLAARSLQRVLPYNDQLPWVPHALAAAKRAMIHGNVAAVFSTSPPISTHIAASLIKKRFRVRWIADLRDPIHGNPFRPGRAAGWWDRFVERMIVREADGVVANTPPALETLSRRYPGYSEKIGLIWNGYDPEEDLAPLPVEGGGPRYLTHVGSLYGGRHPGRLLESLSRLISKGRVDRREICVRLIGYLNLNEPWITHHHFHECLREPWLDCVNRILPRNEAQQAMARSHYLLLLDVNERGSGLQVPAKIFEYIRVGRPILAFTTPRSPTEYILERSGVPYRCIYNDSSEEEIDHGILHFLQFPSKAVSPSQSFREQFEGSRQTRVLASMLGLRS